MAKNKKHKETTITLTGVILPELKAEGEAKGENWKVPPLFVSRNIQTEKNIQDRIARINKKRNKRLKRLKSLEPNRQFGPIKEATREEALEYLPFPVYGEIVKGKRIRYTREEADDLKQRIKEVRKYA